MEGVISLGPYEGPGGYKWSFRARRGIVEITINEQVNIKSISFKDASGEISGTFGGRDPDAAERGQEKKVTIQWPSEYLTSISGTYGNYKAVSVIRSLTFITNVTTHGPFGTTTDGVPFSIPISKSVIVGFHGRAAYYLDALGILAKPVPSQGSISLGSWGGPGGQAFSFRVGSLIKEIIVNEETNIKSITFKDANGDVHGKFGGNAPNDPGIERKIEFDGYSEYLTSISGTYGTYKNVQVVTSLSFITNLTTHGPFGTASGTSFSIPIQHSLVNGFHGRAAWYLDAIGIYVQPRGMGRTVSIGPWGGPGGKPWSYTTNEGINKIIIYAGLNIKSISFHDTSGLDSATFGGENPNDTGERNTVSINWPSEYLTSISGTVGKYKFNNEFTLITSLTITTNLATHGPFGKVSDTSFSIPIDSMSILLKPDL